MADKRDFDTAFFDEEDYDTSAMIQLFNKKNIKVRKIFDESEINAGSNNIAVNQLMEEENKLTKIAELHRIREEKLKRDVEEMRVLAVLKLQKQNMQHTLEAEVKNRMEAAEGLVMFSKKFITFNPFRFGSSKSDENEVKVYYKRDDVEPIISQDYSQSSTTEIVEEELTDEEVKVEISCPEVKFSNKKIKVVRYQA